MESQFNYVSNGSTTKENIEEKRNKLNILLNFFVSCFVIVLIYSITVSYVGVYKALK